MSFDFAHPHALISLYKYYTSKNIQFETWDKATLNVDEIMEAGYDAILTNFDVEGLEHPKLINIGRMAQLQVINELNTISIGDHLKKYWKLESLWNPESWRTISISYKEKRPEFR